MGSYAAEPRLRVGVLDLDESRGELLCSVLQSGAIKAVLLPHAPNQALGEAAADNDVVVAWHERLRTADATTIDMLRAGRVLIVALPSSRLLDARACLLRSDGWLLSDLQLDLAADIVRFGTWRCCVIPGGITAAWLTTRIAADIEALLTPLDLAVLDGLSRGWSNRSIAVHLDIGERRVKHLVRGLLIKLGMPNRTTAAVFACAYLPL